MRLTVLVDNNTYIDQYYKGEPAVSYHMEEKGLSVLLDTGYSDIFIENAEAMEIDLWNLDMIVLSHGHNDHTRGLKYLMEDDRLTSRRTKKGKIKLLAHPLAFNPKAFGDEEIGMPCTMDALESAFDVIRSKEALEIGDGLFYLGEIPRVTDFENLHPVGKCAYDCQSTEDNPLGDHTLEDHPLVDCLLDDYLLDDTAVAYRSEDGIFIITGCSHSGICNIMRHAKTVCGGQRIRGIIGGFHLFDIDGQVAETIRTFREEGIEALYPCHCTSFIVRSAIHNQIPINEVGVGLQLNII